MSTSKTTLLAGFVLCAIIVSVGYVVMTDELSKSSVKGVSVTVSSPPTVTPNPTRTPTTKPISTKIQPTIQIKQYGGWYWQPDLNRAQVWVGTDSAGKDIWVDHLPTPTQEPTTQQSFTQGTVSNTSGGSSIGVSSMTQTVQTKKIEKK